jgi:hypothetical protein
VGIIVAGYANREKLALKMRSVAVRIAPKPGPLQAPDKRPASFGGDAPWALSALPECFKQTSESTSITLPYVLAHLPKGMTMVRPPATLHYADCTIHVVGDELHVERGADRMRVPPAARLYSDGNGLALLRADGGRYQLRVYKVVTTIAAPTGSY